MIHIGKRVVCPVLLASVLFSLINCQPAGKGSNEEKEYILETEIVYGKGGDVELYLDLARPDSGKGPFPALIFLFGGGYASGSKRSFYHPIMDSAKRGYVAVAIDYRLTSVRENGKPKYQFPAQLHDAKCAVRWLRANSRKYSIDKNRIGALGFSAGGTLALMLGLTDSSDGLEGDCGDGRISSSIQAVVNLAGGTDMEMHYRLYSSYIKPLLGGTPEEMPERYKASSPLTYVSTDDPPVLTLCGTRDVVLPQEKLLDDRMKAVGTSHILIIIENAGHSKIDLVDFEK